MKRKVSIEISAGGVVFQMTRSGPRIAMMMDPFGRWTFPKGHVEPGEDPRRAGARETREEIGAAKLKYIASLGVLDFWFRRSTTVHKYVHMFLFQAPRGTALKPQHEEHIRAVRWFGIREARERMGYEDTKEVFARAVRIIRSFQRTHGHHYASHPDAKRTQARQAR